MSFDKDDNRYETYDYALGHWIYPNGTGILQKHQRLSNIQATSAEGKIKDSTIEGKTESAKLVAKLEKQFGD